MKISEKVILVDCDGVLLDWGFAFFRWMKQHGFSPKIQNEYDINKTFDIEPAVGKKLVRYFNESANIGWVSPHKDAVKYVRRLHEEHGFVFHCITSLSRNVYAGKLREQNLTRLFGPTVFDKIECLDCGADKDYALEPYRDTECWWIEDKVANAVLGRDMGLNSILMDHPHNRSFDTEKAQINRASNWKQVYETIVGL